ncbi:MAG: endonuclease domain-containing protein [Rhizobiaceae bacterium]|nr:endonuclease domain-containing protein [Rhizobiaceae bacterium]
MPHTSPPAGNRTRAKSMRRKMTDAELKLWNELRAHRLMGLGFRRQFPIGRYIADFACPERKIIVEVDGSLHAEEKQSAVDAVRSAELEKDGWTVLRFWNDEILRDIDDVCHHIVIAAGLTAEDVARRAPAGALEKRA